MHGDRESVYVHFFQIRIPRKQEGSKEDALQSADHDHGLSRSVHDSSLVQECSKAYEIKIDHTFNVLSVLM